LVANPRYGKSAIAKHIVCEVGQFRKVMIFDYNGEWRKDVLSYNPRSFFPKKLTNVIIVQNMVFKISDFTNPQDFISLGFTPDSAGFLSVCASARSFHHDNVDKLVELIKDLPTAQSIKRGFGKNAEYVDCIQEFNNKYAPYGISLDYRIPEATKMSMLKNFFFIQDWFWKGKKDKRVLYDFNKLWKFYDHIIIDLSSGFGTNENYAQAYVGKILEKLRPFFHLHKPLFVFEEARFLAPRLDMGMGLQPSSLSIIEDLATVHPKAGVAIMLVTQSETMISRRVCEHSTVRLIGTTNDNGEPYAIARQNVRWKPEKNYRTMIMYHANRTWVHFEPAMPCCNVGGGGGL